MDDWRREIDRQGYLHLLAVCRETQQASVEIRERALVLHKEALAVRTQAAELRAASGLRRQQLQRPAP